MEQVSLIRSIVSAFENKRVKCILITSVLLAQVALIIFWAGQRSNYYIDELFSFGSAHAFALEKKDKVYINQSEDWTYEKWIDNSVLKDKLKISEKESLLNRNPFDMIRMVMTGRNYLGILNILMSFFSPGKTAMMPAIMLNLVFFILAQMVLFRIMMDLTESFSISILAILMYGFCGMAISTVLYIRFYMLVTLLLLLLIRLHQQMWNREKLFHCELMTLLSMALIYFAMKNSELVFIVAGALTVTYAIGLLLGKQKRKAFLYSITVFPVSVLYAVTKTSFVNIVLHPSMYVDGDGAEAWMTYKLLTVNKDRVISLIFKYLGWLSDLLFGSWYVLCSFVVILLILLEVRFLGNRSPASAEKNTKHKSFIWVITAVCLIYYIFALLTAIPAERYFMFYFPMLTILFWKGMHELTVGIEYRRLALLTCAVLTIAGAVSLNMIRSDKIQFVYPGDRPLIQAVQESEIEEAIVIYTDEIDSNHATYECINLLPDSARLYPMNGSMHYIDCERCPEQILVWIHYDRSPRTYIADLLENDYELTELGSTHASDVYIAKRVAG